MNTMSSICALRLKLQTGNFYTRRPSSFHAGLGKDGVKTAATRAGQGCDVVPWSASDDPALAAPPQCGTATVDRHLQVALGQPVAAQQQMQDGIGQQIGKSGLVSRTGEKGGRHCQGVVVAHVCSLLVMGSIETRARPAAKMPSSRAARSDRSMIRPLT